MRWRRPLTHPGHWSSSPGHSMVARQINLICALQAISAERPLAAPNGGSRSLSRLRSVTDYGQAAARRRCGPPGGRVPGPRGLPGGGRDVGGDDVGRVPVQAAAARSYRIVVRGSACEAASCTSRSGTPASRRGGDERVPQRVRRDVLGDPGAAGGRADDPPGAVPVQPPPVRQEHGPSVRSPMARSSARAVRGASGMVTIFPPLRVIVSVRCPRSRPRCSMSAPVASETRSPFSASSEISACPAGEPSPAATSSAPSSLRSSATAWDS